ncbi:MAG: PHP domain-containing protein [Planctomycetes bacterium]|nr:PHP domain-containing protein [Planctomycetota bacterium]
MPYFAPSVAPFDLHNHTYWSYDAATHPDTYFRRARELGMRALAVTEHHHLLSWPELQIGARAYPDIRLIRAAEVSVTSSVGAVDLLCYGIPEGPHAALDALFAASRKWEHANGASISSGLEILGFPFTEADRLRLMLTYRPAHAVAAHGPTHIKNGVLRAYLVARGVIGSEAQYDELRARIRALTKPAAYPPAAEVVPVLKAAGVLVALAHPHGYFNQGDRARMDTLRAELQLDGIECAHPGVPPEFTPVYRAYCVEHGLVSVGGTDNHSDEEAHAHLGRHLGAAEWLAEFLERLDRK